MMTTQTSGLLVSFGGHTLRVVSDSQQIITAMQTHLRHCPVQNAEAIVQFNVTAATESTFMVSADGSELFSNTSYDLTLQLLMTELISRLVAMCERGMVFHAAALAYEGNAVILCGQGGSGKSSLAAWLTADSLQYMTDEVIEVPIRPSTALRTNRAERSRSVIHGFTRSVFLKRGSAFIWQNRIRQPDSSRFLHFADDAAWIDPQLFHPNAPLSTATPRLLLFPSYTPGAPLQTKKLTAAEALFCILQSLTNARNLPRHGMDAAAQFARQVTAYSLIYSSLESASEWIQQTLHKSSR